MRTTTRFLSLAVVGAFLAAGTLAAPAQAALVGKTVTSGYVQLALDSPLSTAFAATKPGRTAPNGMFFPVTGVSNGGVSVSGDLSVFDPANPSGAQNYPMRVDFDKPSGNGRIVLVPVGVPQTPTLFTFEGLKASGPTTTVNLKKKQRTVTTTWTGDLRLTDDAAMVGNINKTLATSYSPGAKVGSIGIKVSVTTACKNAACTK